MAVGRTAGVIIISLCMSFASTVAPLRSEHVSFNFYLHGSNADQAKLNAHTVLDNFMDNFSRQLNDSTMRMDRFSDYFQQASDVARTFAQQSTLFFEAANNESQALLRKLRFQPVRLTNYHLVKDDLEDYHSEMENFHLIFSSALNEASDFVSDALRKTEETFAVFSKIQNEIIVDRKLMNDVKCQEDYKIFLHKWTREIFKCATSKIKVIYDVFAVAKYTTYDIVKMLEHKIHKVYSCLQFDKYEFRCRFMRNPESDFDKLVGRLDELEMFLEKQRRKMYWNIQNQKPNKIVNFNCVPESFPDKQMAESMRSCFYSFPYEG